MTVQVWRPIRWGVLMAWVGLLPAWVAMSEEVAPTKTPESAVVRVGGNFRVQRMDRQENGSFRVEFASTQPSGRMDHLILDTDHVHVAVTVGQTIRLSASVLREVDKKTVVVDQVLLFLDRPEGPTPVWLLSKENKRRDLDGARYLEMHAPATDFKVL